MILQHINVGPPIKLTTSQANTSTTTKAPPTTPPSDVAVWTWWTPAADKSVDKNQGNDNEEFEASPEHGWINGDNNEPWEQQDILGDKHTDQVINNDSTEKLTTASYMGGTNKSDDMKNESSGHSIESDKKQDDITDGQVDPIEGDDNKSDIHDEYLELVAHNTRLVDLLRTTLELQADLFRRITKYLFP